MRVLVACEFSGVVRRAFALRGHDTWSCDILPNEDVAWDKNHYQCDVLTILNKKWDVMIAHPPCTHLASSGSRWWKYRPNYQREAIQFAVALMLCDIPKIALENPIGLLTKMLGKPSQIIQPWQFGHGETKSTCLWLKGLPKLTPTNIVEGREGRVWKEPPSINRWKNRARTYQGIADAMANQWG